MNTDVALVKTLAKALSELARGGTTTLEIIGMAHATPERTHLTDTVIHDCHHSFDLSTTIEPIADGIRLRSHTRHLRTRRIDISNP